jgi:hypothetical protein
MPRLAFMSAPDASCLLSRLARHEIDRYEHQSSAMGIATANGHRPKPASMCHCERPEWITKEMVGCRNDPARTMLGLG